MTLYNNIVGYFQLENSLYNLIQDIIILINLLYLIELLFFYLSKKSLFFLLASFLPWYKQSGEEYINNIIITD